MGKHFSTFMAEYAKLDYGSQAHRSGTISDEYLAAIEPLLPENIERTAETGCGKSTILFSNLAQHHTLFAFDDSDNENSSVNFYRNCSLTRLDRIEEVFGSTQSTLPTYGRHQPYDVVLIDGPHGYPFPDLEYYFFYPHLKPGGVLLIDDINIPTIARMADLLVEDDMFRFKAIVGVTLVLQRTNAQMFDPNGDGWWMQRYSQNRVSTKRNIALKEEVCGNSISGLRLDKLIYGR